MAKKTYMDEIKNDIKLFQLENGLLFFPSWNTCFDTKLYSQNKCKECKYRDYVFCKASPNYTKLVNKYKIVNKKEENEE